MVKPLLDGESSRSGRSTQVMAWRSSLSGHPPANRQDRLQPESLGLRKHA